ncbi:MAG TPA: hypothetical protein VLW45_11000 [Pelomicrobium sp.]|nr:hypothetical protein [Pelomicrobium sp.]
MSVVFGLLLSVMAALVFATFVDQHGADHRRAGVAGEPRNSVPVALRWGPLLISLGFLLGFVAGEFLGWADWILAATF